MCCLKLAHMPTVIQASVTIHQRALCKLTCVLTSIVKGKKEATYVTVEAARNWLPRTAFVLLTGISQLPPTTAEMASVQTST